AALNEHLAHGRQVETAFYNLLELVTVVGDSTAAAAKRECWPNDRRKSGVLHQNERFVERRRSSTARDLKSDAFHRFVEQRAILGRAYRTLVGTDQLDAVFREHAILGQRHRDVQRGLASHGREQRVRALLFDHQLHELWSNRLDISRVGKFRVRHDGGGIRVDENHLVSLFLQRLGRLGTGVVELGPLADDYGSGADD